MYKQKNYSQLLNEIENNSNIKSLIVKTEVSANDLSIYVDNEILVIPGESENSYLVKKMRGTSGIMGDVMPPGGMDEEVIQRIERWIDAGALED